MVGGPVAQPGEGQRRLVEGPRASEDVDGVERARPDRVGDGEQLGLGVAEDLLGVVGGRNVDVGGARKPPPSGVELAHRQAVILEQQADVLVVETFIAGHPVVPAPERKAREAAGPGCRHPLPEGDAGPERARAEHGVARAESHRPVVRLACGARGTCHRGRRLMVTIVPFVSEHGTRAPFGAREIACLRA